MANSRKTVVGGAPERGEARDKKAAKPKTRARTAAASAAPRPRKQKPLARTAVKAASATKAKPASAASGAKKAPKKKETARKASASQATAKKPAPRQAGRKKAESPKQSAARARSKAAAPRRPGALDLPGAPRFVPGLSEEDQIRAAKYLPRELPKRVFEEERFLFPESYGQNRIRLLVRDPEWIFAYWDVKPESLEELAKSLGERTLALSRLTLRVVDPVSGGSSDILLPAGARWWYVRTDAARRTYRAELGVTLPSGEFRRLAESNTVVTPRVGPSPERARRRMSYRDAAELAPSAAAAAGRADREHGLATEPWTAASVDGSSAPAAPARAESGGASDAFRPGGASDAFKR